MNYTIPHHHDLKKEELFRRLSFTHRYSRKKRGDFVYELCMRMVHKILGGKPSDIFRLRGVLRTYDIMALNQGFSPLLLEDGNITSLLLTDFAERLARYKPKQSTMILQKTALLLGRTGKEQAVKPILQAFKGNCGGAKTKEIFLSALEMLLQKLTPEDISILREAADFESPKSLMSHLRLIISLYEKTHATR